MIQDLMSRNYPFLDKKICNKKTGLVSNIFQWMPEPDDPRIYMVAAKTPKKDIHGHIMASDINSGAGLSLEAAYKSAIGETIERYCSSFKHDNLVVSSYNNLESPAANPEDFAFYAEEQYKNKNFPYKRFTKDSVVAWTKSINLANGVETYVPASSVYLPYFFQPEEDNTWICISTGLATSTSMVDAILRGIFEIVERDAISNMWFNHLSMPKIDITDNDYLNKIFNKHIKIPNCNYHLVDITTDIGIPCVFGVLDEKEHGALVAASANIDPVKAALKTMIELSQGRVSWKTDFVKGVNKKFKEDFSDIRDFNSRVELYTKNEMKKYLKFVYSSSKKSSILEKTSYVDDQSKLLSEIVKKFESKGLHVYVTDLTPPDIREAGYCTVRVLIPGMTEISNDSVYPRLGGQRIKNLPVILGYQDTPNTFEEFYKIPHPFP
ncbi:YcaO-like family protein [Lactobacillus sp. AN1001]